MSFCLFLNRVLLADIIRRMKKSQLPYRTWDWKLHQKLHIMKEKNDIITLVMCCCIIHRSETTSRDCYIYKSNRPSIKTNVIFIIFLKFVKIEVQTSWNWCIGGRWLNVDKENWVTMRRKTGFSSGTRDFSPYSCTSFLLSKKGL